MWFDAQTALAEIEGGTVPPSVVPSRPEPKPRVAIVAVVARPHPSKSDILPTPRQQPETFPHGVAIGDRPKTWTGRIVSMAEWRDLNEWERHGQNGRHWNGITREWEAP